MRKNSERILCWRDSNILPQTGENVTSLTRLLSGTLFTVCAKRNEEVMNPNIRTKQWNFVKYMFTGDDIVSKKKKTLRTTHQRSRETLDAIAFPLGIIWSINKITKRLDFLG